MLPLTLAKSLRPSLGEIRTALDPDSTSVAAQPICRALREQWAVSERISGEEIKPVLKLKHVEIGRFARLHGVKLQWLLEGVGPIFMSLNPATGRPFHTRAAQFAG